MLFLILVLLTLVFCWRPCSWWFHSGDCPFSRVLVLSSSPCSCRHCCYSNCDCRFYFRLHWFSFLVVIVIVVLFVIVMIVKVCCNSKEIILNILCIIQNAILPHMHKQLLGYLSQPTPPSSPYLYIFP